MIYYGEGDYNASRILEDANEEPRPLAAILEHVFGTSLVVCYIIRLKVQIKMNMIHLYTPKDTAQSIFDEGKSFVEKMLLHRTVGVKLARLDDNGNLIGRLHYP